MDWQELKAADAALGISDPVQAAAALTAQTETVTADVSSSDMRRMLWRGLAFSKVAVLAADKDPNSPQRALADIAITALSLLESTPPRVIAADDAEDWDEIVGALGALVSAIPAIATNRDAVVALRSEVRPRRGLVSDRDVLAVRSL